MIKLLDLVYIINPNHGYLPFNESEFTCIQDFYQHRNCSFKLTEEELQQRTKGQAMCAVKLVEKLGYRPMTLKILKKMRDTLDLKNVNIVDDCSSVGWTMNLMLEYKQVGCTTFQSTPYHTLVFLVCSSVGQYRSSRVADLGPCWRICRGH